MGHYLVHGKYASLLSDKAGRFSASRRHARHFDGQSSGRKEEGSLGGIHDSCDTNIKAPSWIVACCVEAFGSGSVFATRTSRFNRLKAPLRLRRALQLALLFLSCPLKYLFNRQPGAAAFSLMSVRVSLL